MKERRKATTSAARPTRSCVSWICRKAASSLSRLRRGTAAPTIWSVEERIGRKYPRYVSPESSRGRGPIVFDWRKTASTSSRRRLTASSRAGLTSRIVEAATAGAGGSEGAAGVARKTTSVFIRAFRLRATSSLIWNAAAMAPTTRLPPSTTGAATTLYSLPPDSQMPCVGSPWSAPPIVATPERSAV